MTEQLLLHGLGREHDQAADNDVGSLALKETLNKKTRPFRVGDFEFETNLPEGMQVFDGEIVDDPNDKQNLQPTIMDTLPVGDYWIQGEFKVESAELGVKIQPYKRDIKVIQTPKGKVLTTESLGSDDWSEVAHETAGKLMETVGYVVEDVNGHPTVTAVPAPETVRASVKEHGVEVELFPDQGYIDGEDYLRAFSQGKYPVSTKAETQYWHDISDDHITAMILGGDLLRDALSDVATDVLASGHRIIIDSTASEIDRLTATLRAVISWHPDLLGEAYGLEMGRATFLKHAQRLDIPEDKAEQILQAAQTKGRELDLQVKELL